MGAKKVSSLRDVPAFQLCCGCGVCAYMYPDSIAMVDVLAFGRRPEFKISPTGKAEYRQWKEVCPGIELHHSQKVLKQQGLIDSLTEIWGPVFEVWEGHAVDPELRYNGSSGGAITALALHCLDSEGVEGVLHVKADPNSPHLNKTSFSKRGDALLEGAGSRYSPASPCEKLSKIEEAKGESVVIGKPCDIAAIHKVRKLRPTLDEKVALTIACFCAGTPSTAGTVEMLRQMGVADPSEIKSLRYRGCGWPGTTKAKAKKNSGNVSFRELEYNESWGDILQKYRQWRCYICPDHTGEFADLSVGDPWYKERGKDDIGRSLILVRTIKGRKFLNAAIRKGYLIAEKKEPWVLLASQPNLRNTRARLWGQLIALKMLRAPYPHFTGFFLFRNWRQHLSILQKIRSILGTMKRVFKKDLKKIQGS